MTVAFDWITVILMRHLLCALSVADYFFIVRMTSCPESIKSFILS